jgi:glycosyltransferase involved in cell wall biosynthesis
VVLTRWLARRLRVPYAIDLYDNFESFSLTRIPGILSAYRTSVSEAALVTTTSAPLRDYVREQYRAQGDVLAMPSTVDKSVFHPRDRASSRVALGLSLDARLIGTAGGLYRDKGIETLYRAWETLRADNPDLHLVLAGPHEAALPPPQGPRVHYLGALPHARIAELFCALDVGVMCIEDTPFGRFCFPQKAYEMLACSLPVVAADIGAMNDLLADSTRSLFRAGDVDSLIGMLQKQLAEPERVEVQIDGWPALVAGMDARLPRPLSPTPLPQGERG